MTTPKFSTLYDHHDGPELNDFGESRTKQEFAKETDINNILATYAKTGVAPFGTDAQPLFGDFSSELVTDYHQALTFVIDAQNRFAELDPRIRERFANDPGHLLDFISDPNNQEEAVELGILKKPEPVPAPGPTPAPVPVPAPGPVKP